MGIKHETPQKNLNFTVQIAVTDHFLKQFMRQKSQLGLPCAPPSC